MLRLATTGALALGLLLSSSVQAETTPPPGKAVTPVTAPQPTPLVDRQLRPPEILVAQAPRRRAVVVRRGWARPRGPLVNLQLGASIPIGDGASNVPVGFRFGLSLGYELPFRFGTLSPILHFSYNKWGNVANSFTVQVGARFDYYVRARWNFWYRGLIGYGSLPSADTGGLATNHGVGASFRFNRYFGVGIFMEANYITVESNWLYDSGMFSFDLGLMIHGKLPL